MLKYLRIAVTVLSLTACVLLVVLWVRSYFVWYSPHGPVLRTWTVQINSLKGYLFVGVDDVTARRDYPWNWRTFRVNGWGPEKRSALGFGTFVSNQNPSKSMRFVYAPYWLLAALAAALAAAPWFNWSTRFSLRTLFIATTLVAVGLGMIAISN